jgi:PAS domain S-box-containing protein
LGKKSVIDDGKPSRPTAVAPIDRSSKKNPPPAPSAELLQERRIHQAELVAKGEELRRAKVALEEAGQYLRTILDTALDGFAVVDGDGKLVDVSPAYCAMTGFSREEILRMRISDLEAVESSQETASRIRRIREQGFDLFETSHRRKDGSCFPVTASVTFMGLDRGLMVCFFQDVTARRQAEAERGIVQAQLELAARLATMGTLVAGVAHEINNPLAGEMASQALAIHEVKEFVELLRRDDPLDREAMARRADEVIAMLDNAQSGARDIADIVRDLAAFGRPDAKRGRVQLLSVVDSAMRWLRVSVGDVATLQVACAEVPDVVASAGQLEQVVVNLVTNASLAIPQGQPGEIAIRVGPGTSGRVRLEVADNGKGIAPEILARIFEPYFTTRDAGKGTGLGLAISHAIVASHGGTLTVESEVGKGATFRVELPAAAAGA